MESGLSVVDAKLRIKWRLKIKKADPAYKTGLGQRRRKSHFWVYEVISRIYFPNMKTLIPTLIPANK